MKRCPSLDCLQIPLSHHGLDKAFLERMNELGNNSTGKGTVVHPQTKAQHSRALTTKSSSLERRGFANVLHG